MDLKSKYHKIVFLCPGQGSQHIGMGYDFYKSLPEGREVFQEIDEAISYNLSKLIFYGDIEELTKTQNAQPALLAVSVAAWRCLAKNLNITSISDFFIVGAGHSLGEYSALCIANSINLNTASNLVYKRGIFMNNAIPLNVGGMVALLGTDIKTACAIAEESQTEVANDNGYGQIVISGTNTNIEKLLKIVPNYDIKKAIKLHVSSPFHSSIMRPASDDMKKVLLESDIKEPEIPIFSNFTAKTQKDPENIKNNLIEQISNRVRWAEIMESIVKDYKCNIIIELGSGKVLGNLSKRMYPNLKVYNIECMRDIDIIFNELNLLEIEN
ncbi:ACP S-malonyltransferase [Lyticum sinuosum]|uniref:Malonyl CoA-acyl carrier protein transacylase n=1 Tax=Lyticum sinuosum TaxID=1332059 RepID=A0AAE4VIZ7_9RICK|nr:ACP S-malonyltransferase [Lyticum sinuosum]MDZ5760885.1 Malonyl CoA-acyl carrier protein transacylase [Lyticum sinuosum]